jgi:hypothetical protein
MKYIVASLVCVILASPVGAQSFGAQLDDGAPAKSAPPNVTVPFNPDQNSRRRAPPNVTVPFSPDINIEDMRPPEITPPVTSQTDLTSDPTQNDPVLQNSDNEDAPDFNPYSLRENGTFFSVTSNLDNDIVIESPFEPIPGDAVSVPVDEAPWWCYVTKEDQNGNGYKDTRETAQDTFRFNACQDP